MKKNKNKSKKQKAKKGFWKKTYSEIWSYIKESKNHIFVILGLFILSSIIGFLFPIFFVEQIRNFIREILELTKDFNALEMIWFIFSNNIISSLMAILLGIFLGVLPLISCLANGYILGFVSNSVVSEASFLELWRLLPHGIFEIPAVILAFGLGVKLGMFVFAKNIAKEFKRRFFLSMKTFIFVILPLIIIAAIIEGLLIFLIS